MAKRRSAGSPRSSAGPPPADALALQQHEAALRLAAIVNSSDDAIVSKTLDGVITFWNPAAERMFGWTAGEVIGKSITIIVPEDRLAEEAGVLEQLRRGQSIEHYETIRVRKDGVEIPIALTVSPIRDLSGTTVGASKIARDISDRRRAEHELAQSLAHEQAARAEAERASRVKDEFLATLSHELRTPLTSIMGWVRMLRQRNLDEEAAERALEIVDRNSQALSRLVEDILDISSITMGRFRLESAPVDLSAVVRAAVDSVPPVLDGIRVLAVEDEADTRELIATILRQAGADVALAGSVYEALGALATAAPDVVLCDIAMPGRDGYELLREVKRRPGPLARTPFVALTAHVQDSERRRSLAEGFSVHVPKPVDPAELIEVLRTVSRR